MKKTFLCQINVTRACNLSCSHCYISTDKKAASKNMSEEQFLEVIDQLCTHLNNSKQYAFADIHVIGGEPTLLGVPFFESVLPLAKAKLETLNIEYKFSIVTNLLTSKAFKVASLFDEIATSYELDTRFVNRSGVIQPQLEEKWIANVHGMIENGTTPYITMAITKAAVVKGAKPILDYLYGIGFRKIHFGFFIPSGDGLTNIATVFPAFEETSQFLIDTTEWYLERRDTEQDLWVNPVESFIDSITNNRPNDDIVCPIIPGAIDVDWNGETVTCIEAGGEVDMDSLGNVFETSISEIMRTPKYLAERRKAMTIKPNCRGCSEIKNCQQACGILHEFWTGKGECPGFKLFIKHIRQLVEDGVVSTRIIDNAPPQ
ncbi:radical SAM protein [Vibrio splendidus]